MTGYYLRIKRNGKWDNIEIEYLTPKEIQESFKKKKKNELINWIVALSRDLRRIAQVVDAEREKETS